eukprot:GILK01020388.1.p1 GENE.GILK01020388.1~~GILK01020388.1.p1  ORF type:complete len:211 (-),score=19.82 GILK01020388.1:310-942(-)
MGIGIVLLAYAACVAAVRPFLGLNHNALEATLAAIAGICLIAWSAVFEDAMATNGSSAESAALYVVVAISSSRYPFILGRALDVVFPAIVTIKLPSGSKKLELGGNEASLSVPIASEVGQPVAGDTPYEDGANEAELGVPEESFGGINLDDVQYDEGSFELAAYEGEEEEQYTVGYMNFEDTGAHTEQPEGNGDEFSNVVQSSEIDFIEL